MLAANSISERDNKSYRTMQKKNNNNDCHVRFLDMKRASENDRLQAIGGAMARFI